MSIREDLRVPAFCPVCGRLMTGRESVSRYYDFGCCVDCFIEWVEDREERWKGGWRPDAETVSRFCERLKKPWA